MGTTLDMAVEMGAIEVVDTSNLWSSSLAILREQVPEPSFRTWLEGTRLYELEDRKSLRTTATVAVPSTFAAEWLQNRYRELITETLARCLGRSVEVQFKVEAVRSERAIRALDGVRLRPDSHQSLVAVGQSGPISPLPRDPYPTERSRYGGAEVPNKPAVQSSKGALSSMFDTEAARRSSSQYLLPAPALSPRYTFDRFLVGRCNQLAASVARRVAEDPGPAYNPLFIYGYRGVGKTHLLQAVGNDAYIRGGFRVLYVPAIIFANPETISWLIGPDAVKEFDLLLVDDLQHIASAGERSAQRSLAALMDAALTAGKGVVVSATRPPYSMLALHDALRSRLSGGTIVPLELPDAELRLRLASHIARQSGMQVDQDALALLASAGRSMAEVSAIWERVSADWGYQGGQGIESGDGTESTTGTGGIGETGEPERDTRKSKRALTVRDVQRVLADGNSEVGHRTRIGTSRIMDQVASYFDLEANELCGASRERRVLIPRQIAMYLIRQETDHSYQWIAHRFGKSDHTTAMHSCARIREMFEINLQVKQMVLELQQLIYGEHERSRSIPRAG
jgi:chromosomal replication initiator protein